MKLFLDLGPPVIIVGIRVIHWHSIQLPADYRTLKFSEASSLMLYSNLEINFSLLVIPPKLTGDVP